MIKDLSFNPGMVLTRLWRLKAQTLLMVIGISMTIASLLALTAGSNLVQVNMISDVFNSIVTDIDIRMIGENDGPETAIEELVSDLANTNQVTGVITKLFPNPEVFNGSLFVSNRSGNSILGNDPIIGLFGFSGPDLDIYQARIQQASNQHLTGLTTLQNNEAIISSQSAKRLDVDTGKTIFIHEQDRDNQSTGHYTGVTVARIWNIAANDSIFSDFVRVPGIASRGNLEITDFVLVNRQTYINIANNLYPEISNQTVTINGIISVFIDHESLVDRTNLSTMVDRYVQVANNVSAVIERLRPSEITIIWESNLAPQVMALNQQLTGATFTYTLFGMVLMFLPIVIYFILVQRKIFQSKHHFGVMMLRGGTVTGVYSSFLFEGCLVGFFAGLFGVPLSLGLLGGISYYFFPSTFLAALVSYFSYPSLVALVSSSIVIGLVLGTAGHSLIVFQIDSLTVKELIHGFDHLEKPRKKQTKERWRDFLGLGLLILVVWSLWDFLVQFDIGGVWSLFLSAGKAILSFLILLVPLFLLIGLVGLITGKKEHFERVFSPLIIPVLGGLTQLFFRDFWRRSKQTHKIIVLITVITIAAVSLTFLVNTREMVARKAIINEVGSDIRISGEFQQFEPSIIQQFLRENSDKISSSISIISQFGDFFAGYEGTISTRIIALDTPANFTRTIHSEDFSVTLQQQTEELMTLVTGNNLIAPVEFHEQYNWNEGDIRQLTLASDGISSSTTAVNFQVAGFYQQLPVLVLSSNPSSRSGISTVICNLDYLSARINISSTATTSLLIRLSATLPNPDKKSFYEVTKSIFYPFEITILDEKLDNYQWSFEGRFDDVLDIMIFLSIFVGAFGIAWFILVMFQHEKHEFSIYQSRGMDRLDVLKMTVIKVLLVELLGIFAGLAVGTVASILYIDILIPQIVVYRDSLSMLSLVKTAVFLLLMVTFHLFIVVIAVTRWLKTDMITNLRYKE
ncbi:MAG: FtsX-like permease family protein [Candidatus Odinarchaeota archaeon]